MAECILMKSGGSAGSDGCSAAKADVLAGKTAVTKDSNDEAAAGTMPNRGAWASRIGVNGKAVIPAGYHNGSGYVDQAINNRGSISATLGINGTYTIPEGYHNGTGKVTQNIPTMGAQTIIPGNTAKTVSCNGKYMTGNVTVSAVSNLTAANIKKGVTVGGITGTWEGYVAGITDLYYMGADNSNFALNSPQGVKFETACINKSTTTNAALISNQINLTAYSAVNIQYNVYDMSSANNGFVEISYLNGSRYQTICSDQFTTKVTKTSSASLSGINLSTTLKFEIRSNAKAYIYRIWFS